MHHLELFINKFNWKTEISREKCTKKRYKKKNFEKYLAVKISMVIFDE